MSNAENDTPVADAPEAAAQIHPDVLPFRKPDHARMTVGDKPVFDVEVGSLGNNAAVMVVKSVGPAPQAN